MVTIFVFVMDKKNTSTLFRRFDLEFHKSKNAINSVLEDTFVIYYSKFCRKGGYITILSHYWWRRSYSDSKLKFEICQNYSFRFVVWLRTDLESCVPSIGRFSLLFGCFIHSYLVDKQCVIIVLYLCSPTEILIDIILVYFTYQFVAFPNSKCLLLKHFPVQNATYYYYCTIITNVLDN